MEKAGYNVGRIRNTEFAEYVKHYGDGFRQPVSHTTYGALKFTGCDVYSYERLIGTVFFNNKVIFYDETASRHSKTTNIHLSCIRSARHLLPDFLFVAVQREEIGKLTPTELLRKHWGKKANMDCLDFWLGIAPAHGVRGQARKDAEAERTKLMEQYVNGNQDHRDSMRGLIMLAREEV